MLAYVPAILGFGFLGLSFLMLFLGYKMLQQVIAQDNVEIEKVNLSRFFLKIALTFMIVAGPLQWVTIWIQSKIDNKSIVLNIGVSNPDWEEEFGDIYITRKGERKKITITYFKDNFQDNDDFHLETSSVIKFINDLRNQLLRESAFRLKGTPEARSNIEGG